MTLAVPDSTRRLFMAIERTYLAPHCVFTTRSRLPSHVRAVLLRLDFYIVQEVTWSFIHFKALHGCIFILAAFRLHGIFAHLRANHKVSSAIKSTELKCLVATGVVIILHSLLKTFTSCCQVRFPLCGAL